MRGSFWTGVVRAGFTEDVSLEPVRAGQTEGSPGSSYILALLLKRVQASSPECQIAPASRQRALPLPFSGLSCGSQKCSPSLENPVR